MPTYVMLFKFTQQGLQNVKQSPDRVRQSTEAAARFGGKLQSIHYTQGKYDLVGIADFPSDEAAATFALAIGKQGNVSTQTMRAFSTEEMSGLLAKLP
jgi:uncharacterized protein with GYD domain